MTVNLRLPKAEMAYLIYTFGGDAVKLEAMLNKCFIHFNEAIKEAIQERQPNHNEWSVRMQKTYVIIKDVKIQLKAEWWRGNLTGVCLTVPKLSGCDHADWDDTVKRAVDKAIESTLLYVGK